MRFLITLIFLLSTLPSHASLNDVDKANIFGKNLLKNPGFENGKANWTASAGTYAVTTSAPMIGGQHATWDAAASANTLTSDAITIPAGMYGRNGVVSCLITTASGTATHTIQAYDGTNIIASTAIVSSTTPVRTSTNFTFPTTGSISLRLYANANEPSIAIDDCFLGPSEGFNTGTVSQAQFIGSAYFAKTASCTWPRASATLGAFTATAACPGPTIESNPGPGTIQTTDTDLPQITVNSLPPGNYKVTAIFGSSNNANVVTTFALSDGTTTTPGVLGQTSANQNAVATLTGWFSYSSAGNRTFSIYGAASSSSAQVENATGATGAGVYFFVERFPSTSEQAFTTDNAAQSWSGDHDNTCSWARTNTAYGDPATDASCGLTERTNRNFGTVTGANSLPSITFTPKKAGRYYVCATPSVLGATAGADAAVKLWDGTTVISERDWDVPNTTYSVSTPLCGIYNAASTSAVTLSLQLKSSTGALTIQALTAASAIEWSIFAIDNALPAPLIVGQLNDVTRSVTTTDTATVSDDTLILSGASFTETLPSAVNANGKKLKLIHNGTSISQVYTLNTTGGQTIGGIASGSYKLATNGEALELVSDNANWQIINHKTNTDWIDFPSLTAGGTAASPGSNLISAVTTAPTYGTVATHYAKWRRVGNSAQIKWFYRQTTAGTAGSGLYVLNLPFTIDTAIAPVNTSTASGGAIADSTIGTFSIGYTTTVNGTGMVMVYSTTQLAMSVVVTSANTSYQNERFASSGLAFNVNASAFFSMEATVPISGWQP